MKKTIISLYCMLLVISPALLLADTKIKTEKNPEYENISLGSGEIDRFNNDFEKNLSTNGPNFTEAYYLQNMLGYVTGKPHITQWQFGFVLGSSFANGKYWDGEAATDSYPAFAPIVNFHLGFPLDAKSDVMVKLMIIDLFLTGQEPELSDVTIDDYRQFCLGGKYRRQVVGRRGLLPFLFNFDGISVGASGDVLTGYMGVKGVYEMEMEQTTIVTPAGNIPTDTYLKGDYNAQTTWIQLSMGFDVISYFRIMRFINFYTGLGCALGYSWFGMEADSEGKLMASDDSLDAAIGDDFNYQNDHLMTLDYESTTIFNPFPLMPIYIAGIEFDIAGASLTLETAVNLYNLEDVTMLLGLRYRL